MKKLITLIFAIASACIAGYALSNTALILHHEGNVTIFDGPSHLNEALDAAVDGDTLFLPKGSYDGFTVKKKITVRGAGEDQTQINGNIHIQLPADTELEATLLEGLWVMGNYYVYLYGNPKGITISKCRLAYFSPDSDCKAENLTIDRCLITNQFVYIYSLTSVNIINSKIKQFYNSSNPGKDDIIIYNSNIYNMYKSEYFRGSIINSIIGSNYSTSDRSFKTMNLINTLIGYGLMVYSSVHEENVYKLTSSYIIDSDNFECTISNEDLLNNEYLGTDGTIVGCYGGATPYTLALDIPVVNDTKLEVDNVNKVLNVTLKVGATKPAETADSEEVTE